MTTRSTLIAVLGSVVLLIFSNLAFPSREPRTTYYAPAGGPYTITAERGGKAMFTMEIPQGVYLSVESYGRMPSDPAQINCHHGDVTIRVRPANEVGDGEGPKLSEIMAPAPMVLNMIDVTVTVVMQKIGD